MSTAVTRPAADLLPVDVAAMLSGEGREGGTHLAPLCRTVPRQVVSIIIAQRQEPLQACTAVIWASTIIAMGQHEH